MDLAFAVIGRPVAGFVAHASLPPSKMTLSGIVISALVIGMLWVARGLGSAHNFLVALIGFLFSAATLATIGQVTRHIIGVVKPRLVYSTVFIAALLAASIPTLHVLGV